MSDFSGTEADIAEILHPKTIRARANAILNLAESGATHFQVNMDQLSKIVDYVKDVIGENYPSLDIPFHSRWGHFQIGKIDRLAMLAKELEQSTPKERVKAKLDLVFASVLLDAGAGDRWRYYEGESRTEYQRSEGLAIASFHMFMDGAFSSEQGSKFRVDQGALEHMELKELEEQFQVSVDNPLVGTAGRLKLMHELGRALGNNPIYFGTDNPRPSGLLAYFQKMQKTQKKIEARNILEAVQKGLGEIWPGRVNINGVNMGDVWHYAPLGNDISGLVPFHKLSQWLTYSLIEPLAEAKLKIVNTDELTGLAEYRNGGLLLDLRLIELRDSSLAEQKHAPGSELIIEWRALTIALLEKIATGVRESLGKTEKDFPLGKVLEGGTWAAGRKIAAQLRRNASPPLMIESDGTVF